MARPGPDGKGLLAPGAPGPSIPLLPPPGLDWFGSSPSVILSCLPWRWGYGAHRSQAAAA